MSAKAIETLSKLREIVEQQGVIIDYYVNEDRCCVVGHIFNMIDPSILKLLSKPIEVKHLAPCIYTNINTCVVNTTVSYIDATMPNINIYERISELGIDMVDLRFLQKANDKETGIEVGQEGNRAERVIKAIDKIMEQYEQEKDSEI